MTKVARKGRTCEVCGSVYDANGTSQRTCGRPCGSILRSELHPPVVAKSLSSRDLNAPTTREGEWLTQERIAAKKERMRIYMLARYHADPANWSTTKKRRRLFERDGWECRICRKNVREDVPATHEARAVAGHIVARACGGEWTDENMATLCYPCNKADAVQLMPIQTHVF